MRIYSGCGVCVRVKNGPIDVESMNFSLLQFRSKDEAYGWAMKQIKAKCPDRDGWISQEVFLYEVDENLLSDALTALRSQDEKEHE